MWIVHLSSQIAQREQVSQKKSKEYYVMYISMFLIVNVANIDNIMAVIRSLLSQVWVVEFLVYFNFDNNAPHSMLRQDLNKKLETR